MCILSRVRERLFKGGRVVPTYLVMGYLGFFALCFVVARAELTSDRGYYESDVIPQFSHGAFILSGVFCFYADRRDLSVLLFVTVCVSLVWHATALQMFGLLDRWMSYWTGMHIAFSLGFPEARAVAAILSGVASFRVSADDRQDLIGVALVSVAIALFGLLLGKQRIVPGYLLLLCCLLAISHFLFNFNSTYTHCLWHVCSALVTTLSVYVIEYKPKPTRSIII